MRRYVKAFGQFDNTRNLEDKINNFLLENPDSKLLDVKYNTIYDSAEDLYSHSALCILEDSREF